MNVTNYPSDVNNIQIKQIKNFSWPQGKKCAVAIGWHADGEAGPIGKEPRNLYHVGALSEIAYGISTAMPRILELHSQLEIPASFFIPGYTVEVHPDLVEDVMKYNYEVAHHGYLHKNVFLLDKAQEKEEFEKGLEALKKITGKIPAGWSAPGWGVKSSSLEIAKQLGMIYDSSLMEYDIPYMVTTPAGDLVEIPISMILDDYEIFGVSLFPSGGGVNAPAQDAFQIWKEEFDGLRHFGGIFTTTFHPNLMGRPGRLLMLHDLLSYMRTFDDVWFATYEEIANYVLGL
jgi:peptidoglycan-N-acetylglucosamine deacetylase